MRQAIRETMMRQYSQPNGWALAAQEIASAQAKLLAEMSGDWHALYDADLGDADKTAHYHAILTRGMDPNSHSTHGRAAFVRATSALDQVAEILWGVYHEVAEVIRQTEGTTEGEGR